MTYICILFSFFHSIYFHKHSSNLYVYFGEHDSILFCLFFYWHIVDVQLENTILNGCVCPSSPFCLAIIYWASFLLQSPTILNGPAQPLNLIADRLCGEFIFIFIVGLFGKWKAGRSCQLRGIYWKSSPFNAVPFTVVPASGSCYPSEERGSVNGVRGLIISLN